MKLRFCLSKSELCGNVTELYGDSLDVLEAKISECIEKAVCEQTASIGILVTMKDNSSYTRNDVAYSVIEMAEKYTGMDSITIYLAITKEEKNPEAVNFLLGYEDLDDYIDRNYQAVNASMSMPAPIQEPKPKPRKALFSSLFSGAAVRDSRPSYSCKAPGDTPKEEVMAECCVPMSEDIETGLSKRMKHMSDTFSQYLIYIIAEKGMTNAEVYKRALVDKKTFSKIKNTADYHPNKMTAMCLCVGAKLNLDETRDLLMRAGYALSPCDKTDIIFQYFIENEIYDMIEIDIQLEDHGLPCIIA